MFKRSLAARFAKSVFFENINDFDIYVEDTAEGYPKIYSNLLSRSINRNITLKQVFPVGSRLEVIELAKRLAEQNPENNGRRKAVFIIDGDLYLLCGEKVPIPNNVAVLPKYCIENFLLDEDAIVSFMDEEDHSKDAKTLKNSLDFDGWIQRAKPKLTPLFILFAIAHKHNTGIATVSIGYGAICSGGDGEIDNKKVDSIYNNIKDSLLEKLGEELLQKEIDEIEATLDMNECFVRKYVSAKDFSLPLIVLKVRKITKTKAPNISLKIRFSKNCDTSPMTGLVSKIGQILNIPNLDQNV